MKPKDPMDLTSEIKAIERKNNREFVVFVVLWTAFIIAVLYVIYYHVTPF